jgi:hypothetical protein
MMNATVFNRARSIGLAMALAIGAAGCFATAGSRTTVTARTPTFALIEGDLWVIENHDEPVFYTAGFYWRFGGGVWYRSRAYNEGWVTITVVPASIRRIDRPARYARYVAPPEATRQVGPPSHAPAHGVRGHPPGHERTPVVVPPPDRGPPASAGAGQPPEHDKKVAEGKPDKELGKGKKDQKGKPEGQDHGPGKGGKKR